MPLKIGTTSISDIQVIKNGTTTSLTELYVTKNNTTTKVWGKRSFTVTVNNYSYLSSITYSYKDAGGYTKSGSISKTTTFTDVGYNENITITATAKSQTYQYTYSVNTTGGTYTPSTSSVTITGSRTTRIYSLLWSGSNIDSVTFYSNSGHTNVITSAAYGSTVYIKAVGTTGYSPTGSTTGTAYYTVVLNTTNFTVNSSASTATYLVSANRLSYTITFAVNNASYGSWSNGSVTAYYGDIISRNGNVVTCYKWDATSTARWTNTLTTATETGYIYTATYSSITSPIYANQTITATITRTEDAIYVTFPNTTGIDIYNNGTSWYGNYTTYDGTLVSNIPVRMYQSLSSYLSYNQIYINGTWYALNNLPSNWSYRKYTWTYSGRTYYGYLIEYDTSYEDEGETYGDKFSLFVGTNRSTSGTPSYVYTRLDVNGQDYPDYARFNSFKVRVKTS